MKRILLIIPFLVGCGSIDTGNVGVRTTFTGKIIKEEMQQGFYTSFTSSVKEHSIKEITVPLIDMQPKAADNLTLADLDMEVYYKVVPSQVADLTIKYAGRNRCQGNFCYPAYELVHSYARNAVYEAVAKYKSLEIHRNRVLIAEDVHKRLQSQLDKDDEGTFEITKVIVRDVKTDPSIEASIKLAVAMNKKLEAKRIELDVAKKQEQINSVLNRSLTPAVLRQRELDVQLAAIESGNASVTLIMGNGIVPLVSLK